MLYLVIAIASGMAAAWLAAGKARSGCLFFGLGFLIGPLAVLAAALIGRDESALTDRKLARGDLVECPACRSPIHPEATICPHCRTTVIPPDAPPSMAEQCGRFLSSKK